MAMKSSCKALACRHLLNRGCWRQGSCISLLMSFLPPSSLKSSQVGTWMSRQENSSTHSEALSLVNKLRLLSYELTTCLVVVFFSQWFRWLKLPSQPSLETSVGVEAKTFQSVFFVSQQDTGKSALQCLNISQVALVAMLKSSQFQHPKYLFYFCNQVL